MNNKCVVNIEINKAKGCFDFKIELPVYDGHVFSMLEIALDEYIKQWEGQETEHRVLPLKEIRESLIAEIRKKIFKTYKID